MPAYAAVDIGSNSTNLLIVGHDGQRQWHGRVTRLGSDGPSATSEALAHYRHLIDDASVTACRAVATEAVRTADDPDALLAACSDALGWPVQVISGQHEGRLSFAGATRGLLLTADDVLVIDIGGNSTELAIANLAVSMPVGAAKITRHHLASDPPAPEELLNAIGVVHDHLDEALLLHPALTCASSVIGVAGTMLVTAAVEIGRFDIDELHGFTLTREAVEDVFRTLATEPLRDRIHNPGLPADRAEVIVGGCCVLVAIMRRMQLREITMSTTGLLDGLIAELGAA